MAIVRCKNLHYYDDSMFVSCPHCGTQQPLGETVSYFEAVPQKGNNNNYAKKVFDDEKTESLLPDNDKTVAKNGIADDKTIGVFMGGNKARPVVGWLVCTEGPGKGRDYRLHAERNFIGRGHMMDVIIVDDPTISKENHASIIYDPKGNEYYLLGGKGVNTWLNDQPLISTQPLTEGDIVKLGNSTFDFVAYCKGGRKWK